MMRRREFLASTLGTITASISGCGGSVGGNGDKPARDEDFVPEHDFVESTENRVEIDLDSYFGDVEWRGGVSGYEIYSASVGGENAAVLNIAVKAWFQGEFLMIAEDAPFQVRQRIDGSASVAHGLILPPLPDNGPDPTGVFFTFFNGEFREQAVEPEVAQIPEDRRPLDPIRIADNVYVDEYEVPDLQQFYFEELNGRKRLVVGDFTVSDGFIGRPDEGLGMRFA